MRTNIRIEDFAGGYYRTQLVPQPYDDGPVIESSLYRILEQNFYQDFDMDPVFKTSINGGNYFKPAPEHAIPPETIALPDELYEQIAEPDGTPSSFYIVKPEQNHFIETLFDGELTL